MLGLGLESLIPKKGNQGQVASSTGQIGPQMPAPPSPVHPVVPPVPAGVTTKAGTPTKTPDHAPSGWPHREEFGRRMSAPPPQKHASPHEPQVKDSVFHIEVEKIRPNPYQPRHEFDDEELRELAESIREVGIIQPLVVTKAVKETPTGTDVEYQLVAGERRLMAAKLAGLERVPAVVKNIDTHRAKFEMALIENIQRSDLNPLEAARAYARLGEEFGLTQREVAARVGKSREVVANAVRLLGLPPRVQEALARGRIGESQARALLSLQTAVEQLAALDELLAGKVSVRALREKLADHGPASPKNPETSYWERKLEEELGAPVTVSRKGEKGKLSIKFFSEAEWRSIVDRLLGKEE